MTKDSWKLSRDLLYRGDSSSGLSQPKPDADRSIVRHILFLEGFGRETPYLSASETREIAEHFAGTKGRTYVGRPKEWPGFGVKHVSRKVLIQLLRGYSKGDAKWSNAYEVIRARQYAEEWREHLADFTSVEMRDASDVSRIVANTFHEE